MTAGLSGPLLPHSQHVDHLANHAMVRIRVRIWLTGRLGHCEGLD